MWRNDPAAFGGDPAGYTTWRANFGKSAGSGSGNLASVPEPTALLPTVLAAGFAGFGRRRYS